VLNGTWDRETNGFSASCFVTAITDALNRTYGEPSNRLQNLVSENSSLLSINYFLDFKIKHLIHTILLERWYYTLHNPVKSGTLLN